MELQDDCRIMKFPKWSMGFYKWFINTHNLIVELYDQIYVDRIESPISIISFMNVIN